MYELRKAQLSDFAAIFQLYKKTALQEGYIARVEQEITREFISSSMERSLNSGIQLVVFDVAHPENIVAEIHCIKPEPAVFSHVLTETSIVVDPQFQGQGIGKLLFNTLLDEIKANRNDILRLELMVRESNHKAISFYRSIHFKIEGRLERRVNLGHGKFEADIPMAWYNPDFNTSD